MMDLYVAVFLCSLLCELTSALQCYKCDPERTFGEENIPCEHFDGSAKYIRDCEHSTMCYKRETSLNLGNELTTTTTQRGCASQTMSGDQQKINGKWRRVNTIYDVYNEGCAEDPSDIERATTTLYCYCRGDFCNGVSRITSKYILLIVLLGIVLN